MKHAAGHTDSVESAAFSPVLPLSATASIDGQVLMWDNATLSQRVSCSHPEVEALFRSWYYGMSSVINTPLV